MIIHHHITFHQQNNTLRKMQWPIVKFLSFELKFPWMVDGDMKIKNGHFYSLLFAVGNFQLKKLKEHILKSCLHFFRDSYYRIYRADCDERRRTVGQNNLYRGRRSCLKSRKVDFLVVIINISLSLSLSKLSFHHINTRSNYW